jgi:Arabinose-binding domain of AraC transcription regulator, N-term
MRQLCGAGWRPGRVRLARNPPRDKAPFTRFFAAPVDFAEPRSCLVFDAAALDAPVRDSNPDYANILAPLLEEALANARGDFLSSVKAVIRSRIAGALSRDRVCRALGSTRAPSLTGSRRSASPIRASPTKRNSRRRRACSGRTRRSPRSPWRSTSPRRAPSRPGRGPRRRAGGRSGGTKGGRPNGFAPKQRFSGTPTDQGQTHSPQSHEGHEDTRRALPFFIVFVFFVVNLESLLHWTIG